MKTSSSVSNWPTVSILLALGLSFCGCATAKVDWNSRVGNVTYDQIVTDMGPPDKQAKLQDGTLVAEWITRRAMHTTYVSGFYGAGCYPHYYAPAFPIYSDYYSPDYLVRLTFAADGKLQGWKNVRR